MSALQRTRRWALSAALLWTLLVASGQASPALDLFDEAAYHLTLMYGGPSELRPRDLLPSAREALVARCADRPDCPESAAVRALQGVIDALDDDHTGLLPQVAFERLQLELAGGGSTDTFGLVVRAPRDGLGLVVIDVLAGTSAERVGVRRGDRILRIGADFLPANADARYGALLDAEELGSGEVQFLRAGDPPERVTLTATAADLDRLPSLTWLGSVAWIRIPSFLPPSTIAPAFHALLTEARSGGADGLIVDLRDNPGGALTACLAASAAFVDTPGRVVEGLLRQTIAVEEGEVVVRDAAGRTFPQSTVPDLARWDAPSTVLVNAGSGSCAEFMAHDLQREGIPVLGETTAGVADSTTAFIRLPNGMGLAVTTATVRDLAGDRVPPRVTPDHEVADDLMRLAAGEDMPLRAALALVATLSESAD